MIVVCLSCQFSHIYMYMFKMRRKLRIALIGILTCLVFKTFKAETIKTSNSCLTADEDLIQVTCNPGEMIHIISFLYRTASEDCNTVVGDCQVLVQSSDDTMIQNCNGQQSCDETISNEKIIRTCNQTAPVYVTLSYGCISESPVEVCTETSRTFDQQLYLISPDYLKRADDFPSVPCECDISGSDMTVEFLELNLPFFPEDRANVTLLGDYGSWSSYPVPNFLQYNKLVLNQTENVTLFYDARGETRQHMWLRLRGSAEISVECNRQPTTTLTTTVTTKPTTKYSSNITVGTPDTNTAENQRSSTVVLGIVSAIVLVLSLGAVLFFLVHRLKRTKKRQNQSNNQNNGADVTSDELDHGYYNVADTSNSFTALEQARDVTNDNECYYNVADISNSSTALKQARDVTNDNDCYYSVVDTSNNSTALEQTRVVTNDNDCYYSVVDTSNNSTALEQTRVVTNDNDCYYSVVDTSNNSTALEQTRVVTNDNDCYYSVVDTSDSSTPLEQTTVVTNDNDCYYSVVDTSNNSTALEQTRVVTNDNDCYYSVVDTSDSSTALEQMGDANDNECYYNVSDANNTASEKTRDSSDNECYYNVSDTNNINKASEQTRDASDNECYYNVSDTNNTASDQTRNDSDTEC